jgi:hypothetical protein
VTRLLSQSDLLALVDRAAPVVGEIQEDADPIAPGMLFTDARVLLDQLAQRTAGMQLRDLVHWQRRNWWKVRRRSSQQELDQLRAERRLSSEQR